MSEAGNATRKALLDAAEELLVAEGAAGITTRKVADRAGVNQALVHYHFGTIEELLLAVLARVSASVKERATQLYGAGGSFAETWFREMEAATTSDLERGWGKIWLENMTLAANRPRIRKQYQRTATSVRKLHERHAREMLESLGLDREEFPPQGIVTLLDAITSKIILDRLVGIRSGHEELLDILHRLWDQLEASAPSRSLSSSV
jgi:AcrR family transcriptional regulator